LIEIARADDLHTIQKNGGTADDPIGAVGIPVNHHDLTLGRPTVLECIGKSLWQTSGASESFWTENGRHLRNARQR
jgi:hypothetical protein